MTTSVNATILVIQHTFVQQLIYCI